MVPWNKTVFIPVGIPGSGKSTLARIMREEHEETTNTFVSVSADDWFVEYGNGKYIFDHKKLPQAHEACQNKFVQALSQGIFSIYVDNTNLRRLHRQFYVDKAREYGYFVQYIVFPLPKDDGELNKLFERQIHGVPFEGLKRMAKTAELPE